MSLLGILLVMYSVLAIVLVESRHRVDPLVHTKVGLIRGLKATDGNYSKFLGIPYGRVQKNNHFGSSIPCPPFEDVFFAQDDTSACPQIYGITKDFMGHPDCLHLNIYVPDTASSTNKVPVVVHIHGGHFVFGTKQMRIYGPKFLVKHDIILVVIDYRVGVYGFMCLDDPSVPGNQGLKDQLTGLRWVKDNIEAFGGDVYNITLSGVSSGAACVDLLTLFVKEALFDKVIIQSGTSVSPWVMKEPDRNAPFKIAYALGFQGGNLEEVLSYLSSLNSDDVVAKAKEMDIDITPCVEKKFEDVEILIETNPINVQARNISVLIGTSDNECFYRYQGIKIKKAGEKFRSILEKYFYFDEEKLNAMAKILRQLYITDEELTDAVRNDIIEFESDILFHHPTQRSIENYIENGSTVFRYVFSYIGRRNYMKESLGLNGGPTHADELGYLFDINILSEPDESDQLMIDRMTTLWTNFIKFGDPTPETSDLFPRWTPVTESRMDYFSLDSKCQMKGERRLFKQRMAFWKLFYDTYAKMQKGYDENV